MPLRNKGNDYLIDRKLQKTKSYTGIKGVSEQDAAVQDSQGPIADRTREHLGPTDLGILHFRKLVMDCAREPAAGRGAAAAAMHGSLRRALRRLRHPQGQGPHHRDDRTVRRRRGLCRPAAHRGGGVGFAARGHQRRVLLWRPAFRSRPRNFHRRDVARMVRAGIRRASRGDCRWRGCGCRFIAAVTAKMRPREIPDHSRRRPYRRNPGAP